MGSSLHVATLDEQVKRRYEDFLKEPGQLAKYAFLSSLQNRNEILFYRLVYDHLSEMVPLIYTPTVGDVSLHFSILYRQHRGIYFSYPNRHKISEIISHLPNGEIDVIVVTDGEEDFGIRGCWHWRDGNPSRKVSPLYLVWRDPSCKGSSCDARYGDQQSRSSQGSSLFGLAPRTGRRGCSMMRSSTCRQRD